MAKKNIVVFDISEPSAILDTNVVSSIETDGQLPGAPGTQVNYILLIYFYIYLNKM
jgi:hypothetical protein